MAPKSSGAKWAALVALSTLAVGLIGTASLGVALLGAPQPNASIPSIPETPPAASLENYSAEAAPVSCAIVVPRELKFQSGYREYLAGNSDPVLLGLDALVLAESYVSAASLSELNLPFSEWLSSRASALFIDADALLNGAQQYVLESGVGIDTDYFVDFCPEYSGLAGQEEIPSRGEVPMGALTVKGNTWASCQFSYVGTEIASSMGVRSASYTFFVLADGKIEYLDEIEVPLDKNQLGTVHSTAVGDMHIVSVPNLGDFEYLEFSAQSLPQTGDVTVGCSKQFWGQYSYPRVLERVTLNSELIERLELR